MLKEVSPLEIRRELSKDSSNLVPKRWQGVDGVDGCILVEGLMCFDHARSTPFIVFKPFQLLFTNSKNERIFNGDMRVCIALQSHLFKVTL